jgi:hypothetical protein
MRPRAERVLLLRSGRHLRVAMEALTARWPGCAIGVVGTPGAEPAIAQAGVAAGDCFVYPAPRLQPLAFVFSATALAARRWGYDRVAILWNDPDGTGQGNVDRTALAMGLRGYVAVTPDGRIVERSSWPQVRTECLRVVASLAIAGTLGVLLYLPALVAGAVVSAGRAVTTRLARDTS